MDKINQLAGSFDYEDFIQGLLLTSRSNSLGDAWEKCATCRHCMFAKQCRILGEEMEARGQNPSCSNVVDILLGDLNPDDVSIPKLNY